MKNKLPPVMMKRKGYWYVRLPRSFMTPDNSIDELQYDNILSDQRIQFGEPCIRGTRVPALTIWSMYTVDNYSIDKIQSFYDHLTKEQIQAAIDYIEGK